MAGPQEGFLDSAFEEPRQGRTRVFRGNREGDAPDETARITVLASQVEEMLTRVHEMESRLDSLEGDLGDEPDEYDPEPPI